MHDSSEKMSVEQFTALQIQAVDFLADVMNGVIEGTEETLKARIIAAQTLIAAEAPLDTEAFIDRIREQLHEELRQAGIDVDGALAEKKVVLA